MEAQNVIDCHLLGTHHYLDQHIQLITISIEEIPKLKAQNITDYHGQGTIITCFD